MAIEANSHWMDRVRAAAATMPAIKPYRPVALVSIEQDSREFIAARIALHARKGIDQDALYVLARNRRREALRNSRPAKALIAIGLLAAGIAVSLSGNTLENQWMLLTGFGIAFTGLMVACSILAGWVDPQIGDLAKYLREEETPANADEITALSRAAQADMELGNLIVSWWKDSGAPIRRHDLALVRTFQELKAAEAKQG